MNSSSVVYDVKTWPNTVAAIMLTLSSFLGIVFNYSIIRNFFSDKKQKSAFNMICTFRASNNLFILIIVMLAIYVPASITGYSYYPPLLESIIIAFGTNLMIYNELQSIYTAVNRLFAITFPLKYNVIFGIKVTLVLHILYYLDRIRNVAMEHVERYQNSNYLLFSTEHLAYGGLMVAPDGMFKVALALLVFPFLINAVTFVRFYYLKKRTSRESEHWKKAKENMVLFAQTVLQDSLFSITVIFTMKLNTMMNHRFWTFFCQTYVWQIIHVLDGFIMLVFNDKISLFKKPAFTKVSPALTGKQVPERNTSTVVVARPIS
ncbi:hypothetical protein CRE_18209 [Caenorhabditis remanei]|uniref:7TM GPCR serpentine receptor class x (Srx) domain-containing protein n=1 Tax=Caenorhabditis remanei TaxID=31234 RepID=E3NCH4_CAERE|nr:hypothetical protein CRE_18209 [Caenorhabditis remanei]